MNMNIGNLLTLIGIILLTVCACHAHLRLRRVRALAISWKRLSWGWEAPSRDPELFDTECERLNCARELLRTLGDDERAA